MTLDQRLAEAARGVAEGVTPPEVDLDVVRHRAGANRRRAVVLAAVAAAVAVTVGVTVGLVFGGPDQATPPVDQGRTASVLVQGVEPFTHRPPPSEIGPLPDPGTEPYPVWSAFDQDPGRFLFTASGESAEGVSDLLVLAPGQQEPVAAFRCDRDCNWHVSFGPGPDEVTTFRYPRHAQVWGFDGKLRDEIDLGAVLQGSGIADLEWSPDGSRLAVSTFTGGPREPACPSGVSEARVWIFDQTGGDPVLAYSQRAAPRNEQPYPVLSNLAWASDSQRLGLVASSYCVGPAASATLVAIDVDSGQAKPLHDFYGCDYCGAGFPWTHHGFAWSPDGTRIAVTGAGGITEISSEGTTIVHRRGSGHGPLAWLAPPTG